MSISSLLIAWLAGAVAFWVTAIILPGFSVAGGFGGAARVAVVFGLVQWVAGWLLPDALIRAPSARLTLGTVIQVLILTALMMLTDKFSKTLKIRNFWWAASGAVAVAVGSRILEQGIHRLLHL